MKLLIIDDHPVLREGLGAVLMQIGPDTEILQAGSASAGLQLIDDHADLNAVVLDLVMPDVNGFEVMADIVRKRPALPVLVLSSLEDPDSIYKALAAGAAGYVPKSASSRVLLAAIRLVLDGERYIPPIMLTAQANGDQDRSYDADRAHAGRLTGRQVEILFLLSKGHPNKTIATALDVSEKTVKAHITAIFKSLNVVNRTQAAAAGRKLGLIA